MKRTRKRRNGAGTIVTIRRAGKITGYAPELTLDWTDDGKRQKVRGRVVPTWDEANIALEELKRQHRRGIDLTDRQTLGTFVSEWIESTFAPANKPKSIETYSWALKHHIVPNLGDILLQRLTGQQVQRFITSITTKKKLAAKSVILIHTVLHSALDKAKKWKLITDNPADNIVLPKVERKRLKAFTPEQARAFLAAARGDSLELALRLCLSLGLRRGEVAGLRWCDVDFEVGRLQINGSLVSVVGQGLVWGTPKSEASRRSLKLPATLLSRLRQHRIDQQAERVAMEGKWKPVSTDPAQDYIFVSLRTGGPLHSGNIYDAFKRIAKAAGLPEHFSPHSLRHSCASFLYAEGVPDKVISAQLGHSSTTITKEVYITLYQDMIDDTAERIERLLTDDPASDERRTI